MVWLNLKAKQQRDLVDHGHSSLGVLPVWSAETKVEKENAGLKKHVSRFGFKSWEVVPLETDTLQTYLSSSRKEQISVEG